VLAGHVGVAIGALGIRRTVPLWLLIIASQLPDWTDAILCSSGVRSATPGMLSHSIVAVASMAAAAALAAFLISRDPGGSLLVAAVVVTHLLGDFLTGLKPTWPGGPLIGLELYKQPAYDFIIEALIITAGWILYQRSLDPAARYSSRTRQLLFMLIAVQALADIALTLSPGMRKC
jgi:hypothetical protein